MHTYTQEIIDHTQKLDPMDEEFVRQLEEQAGLFRPFHEALKDYLARRGWGEDCSSQKKRLRQSAQEKRTGTPARTIAQWFTRTGHPSRQNCFLLCFLMDLNLEEARDFFQRIVQDQFADFHSVAEVIYVIGLRDGLSWQECEAMIQRLQPADPDPALSPAGFTSQTARNLLECESEQELARYIQDHPAEFIPAQQTALAIIQDLYEKITRPQTGLLDWEKQSYAIPVPLKNNSRRSVLHDLLFLDESGESSLYILPKDHSCTGILKANPLLAVSFMDCFPSRQSLSKVLSSQNVSSLSMRKLLILLGFYGEVIFFMRRNSRGRSCRNLSPAQRRHIIRDLDAWLLECGFSPLYYGSSYDWLFLFCLSQADPLFAFRSFMSEVYLTWQDTVQKPE